ncbi:MAG: DUF559 domain-containing protein [Ectothiorhodospiraceae bacterium]|jgi:very-short-patch-repair endonuclease|nr:DUF559 domain-containing protein [Ectothiorhodospiraceae bacterium]
MDALPALHEIPPGRLRTFLCHDPLDMLRRLRDAPDTPAASVLVVSWSTLPVVPRQIEDMLAAMADAAAACWPDDRDQPPADVLVPWFRAASRRVDLGLAPLLDDHPHAAQARQLALLLARGGPDDLCILLVLESVEQPAGHLLGFARAAEWLARETAVGVAVLLPTALGGRRELDAILSGAVELAPPRAEGAADVATAHGNWSFLKPSPGMFSGRPAGSFLGGPHPSSPGERLLAERLAADAELAGRFEFNVPVDTSFGTRHVVDLLWRDGALIVEVDGYQYHGGREAFRLDRQRDFELMLSGYRCLRLAHDEVMENVLKAIDKIRAAVRWRNTGSSS